MKLNLIPITAAFAALLTLSAGANQHCPQNCVPLLAGVCDTVEDLLQNVPVIKQRVPFVLEVVGRAICFPEDPAPVQGSLCPKTCGKSEKTSDMFTRVCNYVDDILQATTGVPKKIRSMTDEAICAIADLIPEDDALALAQTLAPPKPKHDPHCPANCMPEVVDICDKVVEILENVPVVGKLPNIADIVGKAICFPSDTKPDAGTLCPTSCGKSGKAANIFPRVCHYVDNILQSTPGVSKKVRNITDIAICTIGSLIPSDEDLAVTVASEKFAESSFCPEDCEEKLQKVCTFVEDIISKVPSLSELADKEIGRAICFPETAKPHPNSMCAQECGNEESQKICEYIDLLMQIPQVPEFARKITTEVVCKLAEKFNQDLVQVDMAATKFLRK